MKKYLLIPLLLAMGAQAAVAAPLTKQVKITAVVSPDDFIVRDEGAWMNVEQKLGMGGDGNLTPVTQRLYVKATEAVTAKFVTAPTITSGKENIPLTLTIAGTDLDATAHKEIISKADAAGGKVLEVSLGAAPGPYVAGNYFGYMDVMFDVAAP